MNCLSVILFLNELELIRLYTFNGFKYCYLTLVILYNINPFLYTAINFNHLFNSANNMKELFQKNWNK